LFLLLVWFATANIAGQTFDNRQKIPGSDEIRLKFAAAFVRNRSAIGFTSVQMGQYKTIFLLHDKGLK